MFICSRRNLPWIFTTVYFLVSGKRAFMEDVDSRLKMGWGLWRALPSRMKMKSIHSGWLPAQDDVRTREQGPR